MKTVIALLIVAISAGMILYWSNYHSIAGNSPDGWNRRVLKVAASYPSYHKVDAQNNERRSART